MTPPPSYIHCVRSHWVRVRKAKKPREHVTYLQFPSPSANCDLVEAQDDSHNFDETSKTWKEKRILDIWNFRFHVLKFDADVMEKK